LANLLAAIFLFTLQASARSDVGLQSLKAAADGIGTIELLASKGQSTASVLLIPEIHGVILVQLDEALLLHRLKSSISSIVLEGLLPEAASQLSRPTALSGKEGVALLKDGTISAAEFMY